MKKLITIMLVLSIINVKAQNTKDFSVIGYYAGDSAHVDEYPVEKLTHIIFSFCHLQGNLMHVNNERDSITIQHLVELKKRKPSLKVILSIGGWGGCDSCSPVFATDSGRKQFALSVKNLSEYFKTDGIDLDWEYPAISGFPDHPFMPADKQNFTLLVQTLRNTLGKKYEISFAAGGFTSYLKNSVEWDKLAKLIDKVNLMSYDLISGFSSKTGHHTPLYSTPQQIESTDNAIRFFDSTHFPLQKVVIGAAMYGRMFNVDSTVTSENGLNQPGSFDHGISWKNLNLDSLKQDGYIYHWDDVAKAPTLYNDQQKKFFTYDNERSIMLKTQYALRKKLNGIMFWQLVDDKPQNGLLDVIDNTIHHPEAMPKE